MKRFITLTLCMLMLLATYSMQAFIVATPAESTMQASLVAVLPVDVSTSNKGLRQYSQMVKTDKIYQEGDIITVAVIIDMKNIAKHPSVTPAANKAFDVMITSDTIDFSYYEMTPRIVSSVLAADRQSAVKIASNTVGLDPRALLYDSKTNSVIIKARGVPNGTAYCRDCGRSVDGRQINQLSSTGSHIQTYAPFNGSVSSDSESPVRAYLPAINSANYTNEALTPDSVQYAFIISGITKAPTASADGNMEARIRFYN